MYWSFIDYHKILDYFLPGRSEFMSFVRLGSREVENGEFLFVGMTVVSSSERRKTVLSNYKCCFFEQKN